MYYFLLLLILLPCAVLSQGSFPPGAGLSGTTAIHKDSSVFVGWATNCITSRGPQDIAVPGSPLVTLGDDYMATDKSGVNGTVSLGDGGEAILTFNTPITDEPGWDFAVFENSFDGQFLELAFVEVSSDGINYFRFPATSEVQDTLQTDVFGNTDPTGINNLAGKYKVQYGTPFDLNELNGIFGLDIDQITHVKVIDVIGTIDENYATIDQHGQKINDPYPTDFNAGGFDLDAVGVIHQKPMSIAEQDRNFSIYPNPAGDRLLLTANGQCLFTILNVSGETMLCGNFSDQIEINLSKFSKGLYFVDVNGEVQKLIIQ